MKKAIPWKSKGAVWDPRILPAYGISEAAQYLRIPKTTLQAWFAGTSYRSGGEKRRFRPPLSPAATDPVRISFINLVEAHMLDALRKDHRIPLQQVRTMLQHLRKMTGSEHPLAEEDLQTRGKKLFVKKYAEIIGLSDPGQFYFPSFEVFLERIERDRTGLAKRLYPFTRKDKEAGEPRFVLIDPRIAFGRPVIAGTGIPTAIIAERYKAGESDEELAEDYGIKIEDVKEAIRCELSTKAA